ncbi:MAG: dephospho-CoA kinase [Acidobacteriota bacterium]|nr:dephospho-CoA kinase [Blastocatellia bacterium]MDW8241274.1 dephospho-CoA kinase [Acidobacteriota bacterium]
MLKVGLTGGIATGKSHVLSLFKALGCHVIDADQIARQVVAPGQPALNELVNEFGPQILDATGHLDRAYLANLVFQDEQKREQLNAIVHPRVIQEIARQYSAYEQSDPNGIVIVDGALIIETGLHTTFDVLIVTDCDPQQQLNRLVARDRLSEEAALNRIRAQMPAAEKKKHADFVIDTSGSFENTRRQVEQVYQALRAKASTQQGA